MPWTTTGTSGSSGGGSTGRSSSTASGGGSSAGGSSGANSGTTSGGSTGGGATGESWVWLWDDDANSVNDITANAAAFTHVSPTFYDVNYAYASGAAEFQGGADSFGGMTSAQITQTLHGAGLKVAPCIQGGQDNGGTDTGIENILNDVNGAQGSFITAMMNEATSKGYDGYNIDFETDQNAADNYALYGRKLTSFLSAFHTALAAQGMNLSIDVAGWLIHQSNCSGDSGFIDLAQVAPVVDELMVMAYEPTLGTIPASCPNLTGNVTCGSDVASDLNLLCSFVPAAKVNVGLEALPTGGSNQIAGQVFAAMESSYGFSKTANWPGNNGGSYVFMDPTNLSPSGTWYALLESFLAFY